MTPQPSVSCIMILYYVQPVTVSFNKRISTGECAAHLTHLFLRVIKTRVVKTAHDKGEDSKKISTYIENLMFHPKGQTSTQQFLSCISKVASHLLRGCV